MQEALAGLPGMRMVFTQPIEMRVNEMVAGVRADLGVKLFGDDLEVLRQKAAEVQTILESIPGASDVTTEQVTGQPILQIAVDRQAAARHGVAARDIMRVVGALGTLEVGEMQEGERRFPIAIRLDERLRRDERAIGRILVNAPGGARIPLARLARIETVEGPAPGQPRVGRASHRGPGQRARARPRLVRRRRAARAGREARPADRLLRQIRRPVREPRAGPAAGCWSWCRSRSA